MTPEELRKELDAILGVEGEAFTGRDPVNVPQIRHWCDAVDDRNPLYTDPDFAKASSHGGLVAPPAMLQAWTMPGLRREAPAAPRFHPLAKAIELLDACGYTSVVATNCRQEYVRYLAPGDLISVSSHVESVSDEKKTALGAGRFITEVMTYRDQQGDEVARMKWSILKFKPPEAPPPTLEPERPAIPRPRPAQTQDNAFFWEGVANGELLIQRCNDCGSLRHPPGPMCPSCHCMEWGTQKASGRGTVFSFVVAHYPPIPPFEYPNLIVLVELEEGPRIVSNLVGIDPADAKIGMAVEVEFTAVDPELTLPLFRPSQGS